MNELFVGLVIVMVVLGVAAALGWRAGGVGNAQQV